VLDARVVRGLDTAGTHRRLCSPSLVSSEVLTGKLLDADDVSRTGYINILDPKLQVTGSVRRVRRQRVNNNLLGDNTYCPLIRRTDALKHAMASGLDLGQVAGGELRANDPGSGRTLPIYKRDEVPLRD
jgi:hypothetical protein